LANRIDLPTIAKRIAPTFVFTPASPRLRWITALLLLVAAGLAIVLPFVSATLLTIALGSVAVVAGLSQLLRLLAAGELRSRLFRGLSALLYLAGGVWVLIDPIDSEVSLTLFAGLLLTFEGVMELAVAASGRSPARAPVLVDGIVTAVLGGLLIAEWPSDSVWAVGTLLGITLGMSALNLLTAPSTPELP
jgi:uncharacterized membrane protein HdeD (DUF308 family)